MEKLNELVEQAKEMSQIHGSEWDNALSKYPDGAIQFEVVSTQGETIVTTGRDKKADSWLCDYLVLCSPGNILAIAEEFRALEKNLAEVRQYNLEYAQREVELEQRAESVEAKLAELEKQEPYGYVAESPCSSGYGGMMHEFSIDRRDAEHDANQAEGFVIELFTRPAPAADLVFPVDGLPDNKAESHEYRIGFAMGCASYAKRIIELNPTLLRNIEEQAK